MKKLEVVHLPVEKLEPNSWNVNLMSEELYAKLREYLRREGLVEPLIVRPKGGSFEIVGGYHRWKICKELGYTTVPCVVVDLDDRRAKILSVNLNQLKGEPVQDLLAKLIHDLNAELSLDDLARQLPYDQAELDDLLEVLKIPDGLEAFLKEKMDEAERDRPKIVTFVVDDPAPIEQAVEAAQIRGGPGTSRGRALLEICRNYLSGSG